MIHLLCVEDDPSMRSYLTTRLAEEPDIRMVSAVSDIRTALIYLRREKIDVVLLDLHLHGLDGTHLLQAMYPQGRGAHSNEHHPAVLFCTGFADEAVGAQARLLGAHGVLSKDQLVRDLIPAVRTVARGDCWFNSDSQMTGP
jgi:DNA-binding NarL/FixJ family response regulator